MSIVGGLTIAIASVDDLVTLTQAVAPLVADYQAGKTVTLDDVAAAAKLAGVDLATLDQVVAAMPDSGQAQIPAPPTAAPTTQK